MSETATTKTLKRRLPRSLKKKTTPKPETIPEAAEVSEQKTIQEDDAVSSPISDTECEELVSTRIDHVIREINENLKMIKINLLNLKPLKKEVRSYETKIKRLTKKKNKRNTEPKKPNGFAKPVEISEELSTFLRTNLVKILKTPEKILKDDKPKIVEYKEKINAENIPLLEKINNFTPKSSENKMARTDMTKLLTRYVKYHDLQNPEKRTNILITSKPGAALGKLFSEQEDNVDLTFMTMQRYISHHFKKKDAKT